MCIVTYSWKSTDSIVKIKQFMADPKVRWAEIDIAENCNFNCIWCYADAPGKKENQMSYEIFKRIIDKLARNDFIQVTLSGGEPLLHKNIDQFVEYAHNKGLIVHINSNGFFLTKNLANKLKELGLSQIQMNLESLNPQLHDFIRGKSGSHRKVLEAFRNAYENEINTVALTVISSYNCSELKDLMIFARDHNIPRFRVWDMVPKGKGKNQSDIYVKNYSEILNDLTTFAIEAGIKNIISYDPMFNYERLLPPTVKILEVPCPHARGLMMNIDVNGMVNICCTVRNRSLYSILQYENIQEIHKEKNEAAFNSLKNMKNCQSCVISDKCNGGCIARYDQNNKDLQCIKF